MLEVCFTFHKVIIPFTSRRGRFFSNARNSILCANVMICLLYLSVVQNGYISLSNYSNISFRFQIMAVFFSQNVCNSIPNYCYDFCCLILTAFKKGTILKPILLSSFAIWLCISECASCNLKGRKTRLA